MAWSEQKCAGLALAALLHSDRELRLVGCLPESVHTRSRARLSHLDVGDSPLKTRLLRELVDEVRGELRLDDLPTRARALLARHVPRELGRKLLEGAPETRIDYAPSSELLAGLIHRARQRQTEEIPDAAALRSH